ncbi:AAA family ATPase [Sulfurivermis fontis]|uniref:bifunctional aminoglycoside phosphotransferase/ATP-binding protein n=1 Tax=Sulfurivermis fontis TaxID=1972068 RepID=UPI000FDA06F2|nr:bifunctional aminoglycoside phosphotransferase/ATP-binding protein [Sulfurivermis fontis]
MSDDLSRQRQLVQALLRREQARLGPAAVQLLETHISWLLLAGEHAYKLKKPLDLGFLDYSTLERRRRFCEEEVRLNRRTAPQIYLTAVPVTGTLDSPCFGGEGPILEYAVQMRRFPPGRLLDDLLHAGRLTPPLIDTLAHNVADFHAAAARVDPASPWGTPEAAWQPVRENFEQIAPRLSDAAQRAEMQRLAVWAAGEKERLTPLLAQRRANGHIRECHGDLHLGNIVLLAGQPCPFDGIEFNDGLRWIDTISDSAFLMMDLRARGRSDYAWRFLDAYLQHSGDYAALPLLPWYLSYRAMVRAKVAAIRASQAGDDTALRQQAAGDIAAYLQLAAAYAVPRQPFLVITRGLSGSGKTRHSQALLEQLGLVRLRSDVERKRLFGLTATARSGSGVDGGIYTAQASEQTYAHLAATAEMMLQSGQPVLIDATFLRRAQRVLFRQLAERLGLPFLIVEFHASEAELRRRIEQRSARGKDASEAGLAVLERQIASQEPLGEDERLRAIRVDTGQNDADTQMLAQVMRYLPPECTRP